MTNRTSTPTMRWVHLGLLLVIFLLGMALRLHGLGADSLWADEILTSDRAQLDLHTLLALLASGEGRGVQMPLPYVVSHFFEAYLGTTEFTLRLPAMLAGSLSVLLIYKLGEVLWSRSVGLAAAFLLAVNALHIQYSQEARHYALMVFLAMMSVIFLTRALQRKSPGLWLGFVLSTTLGLYNHYFAFLFLPAEIALAAWLVADNWSSLRGKTDGVTTPSKRPGQRPKEQLLALCLSLALVAVFLLPWAQPILSVVGSPAGSAQLGLSLASLQSSLSFLGKVLVSFSGVSGLALTLWLGAFMLGCARSSWPAELLVVLGMATPLVFLSFLEPQHGLFPKYVLFSLPLYLLCVATGLLAGADWGCGLLSARAGERQWSPLLCRTLAVLLLAGLSMVAIRDYYRWDKEDWGGAAAYLQERLAEDDIVIADGERYGEGGDSQRALDGLTYYFAVQGQDRTMLKVKRGLADSVEQNARAGAGVWGVLYHMNDLRNPSQLGDEVELIQLADVALLALPKPTGDPLDDTISILHGLAEIQPMATGRFDVHLALTELYLRKEMPEEALLQARLAGEASQQYATEVELYPSRASRGWGWRPYWDLGSTYESVGMLEEAAEAYQEVLALYPSLMEGYLRLGSAYRRLNEPAKALAVYQQATQLEPENPELLLLLGEAYQSLGLVEEALRIYNQVLRIDPSAEWARVRSRLLTQPDDVDIPHPLLYSLGMKIALVGYDLSPGTVEAGGALNLTLWWQALADMDTDYTAFIHLTGPDGRIWAQEDLLLLDGQLPTSGWRLGDVVKKDYELQVPAEAPPAQYTVNVGLYFWETGERLPVWNEQGQREPSDAATLNVITVTLPHGGD